MVKNFSFKFDRILINSSSSASIQNAFYVKVKTWKFDDIFLGEGDFPIFSQILHFLRGGDIFPKLVPSFDLPKFRDVHPVSLLEH